ncbi:D-arabinose 1-dehydrogenase [Aureococcus anophagefferens]|nr:D-arabinose 1-dehydrogenase [Aureococcus anophagefferens]
MVDTLPIVVAVACVVVAGLVVAATRHTRAAAAAATGPLALKTADLAVGDILVGTSPLGGIVEELSDDEAEEVVERCVEVGFRHFDTAPHYGLGVAESRLGAGLRRGCAKLTRTRRAALKILDEEVRVWTKVGRVIKTKDTVAAGDVVEADNLPGSSTTIYLRVDLRGIHIFNPTSIDSPEDAVPVLDYSAAGAAKSYAQSLGRLGPGVVVAGLRCHDPESPALEARRRGSLPGLAATGAPVLAACAARGVRVEVAGAYASGLLAGGPNYEYKPATPAHVARRDAWAALAADHGVSLKAAALKFAFLPAAVSKVALGLASTAFVDETVDIIAEANAVPAALWKDAVARGLLAPDLLAL